MSTTAIHDTSTTPPRVFPRTPETHQRAHQLKSVPGGFPAHFQGETMKPKPPHDRVITHYFEQRIQEGD